MPETTQHYIAGEWREGAGETLPDVNPSTGKPLGDIAIGTAAEVDEAVTAARRAFEGGWGRSSPAERRKALLRLSQLVADDAMELGRIGTEDNGMPFTLTSGEAIFAAEYLEYFAGWADRLTGDVIPLNQQDVFDYTMKEPIGVVAAIVPWNAPVFLAVAKLAPALAAGCTVVLKPSELAPLSPIQLVACAERAGLPPGVVNLVTGSGDDVGAALVAHPGVDKVSFTGGTELGRIVGAEAARTFKRCSLELGGKSANIVFADADLDAAAMGATLGVLVNTGQQCVAGSRVLVQRPVYGEFVDRLAALNASFAVGDPRRPETMVGPIISERHLGRVLTYVAEASARGRVVLGGERLGGELADGYFLGPTIVADVDPDARLYREEVFGPVTAVLPFEGAADAIAMANDTDFGLAGGVWTRDLDTAHGVAGALRTGTVWVNTYLNMPPSAPFGGHKASGLGREGGWAAIEAFTELTNVFVQLKNLGKK